MIYEDACNKQASKNKHPVNWAIDFIQRKYNSWSTPNEKASAEKLIQNWIHGKENAHTPSYLLQFMQALGFQPIEGQAFTKKDSGKNVAKIMRYSLVSLLRPALGLTVIHIRLQNLAQTTAVFNQLR